jgi:hypothetical protein
MPKHEPPPGIEIVRVPDPQVEAREPTRLEEWIREAGGQVVELESALPLFDALVRRFVADVAPHCPIDLPGGWRLTTELTPGGYHFVVFSSAPGQTVCLQPPASALEEVGSGG